MNDLLFDSQFKALNSKLGRPVRLLVLCALLATLLIALGVYKAPAASFVLFAMYIAFYMIMPGLELLCLLKVHFDHISTHLLIGAFTGWGLLMGQYFLFDALHTNVLLYIVGPVLSAGYIYTIVINRSRDSLLGRFRLSGLSSAALIFLLMVLLYALLNTQYIYINPEYSASTYMNPDKGLHMGMMFSLSYDYPMMAPDVYNREITYHIFTEVLYAVAMKLFGLTADFLLMSAGPYFTAGTLCLSIYTLFREFAGRKDRAGIYSLLVLLSNMYLARNLHSSLAFRFVIINENVAGYGVAGTTAFIIVMKYWYDSFDKADTKIARFIGNPGLFLVSLIILMTATGIKGPIAATAFGAVWGTFVVGAVMKKISPRLLLPLIIFSISFIYIYLTVLGSKGVSNGSGESIFAFASMTNVSFWKKPLIELMKGWGIPSIVRLGIVLLVFLMFLWTIFFLPLCMGYLRELYLVFTGRKKYEFSRVVIYATIMVGMILMMFMNYSGHSQIYFGFLSILWAPLVAFWFIEDVELCDKDWLIRLTKATIAISTAVLVLTTASLARDYIGDVRGAVRAADSTREYSKYMSMSHDEYEAMMWLRDSTPADSLVASDRTASVPPEKFDYTNRWASRFFLYAIYSERFYYLAGSGYYIPPALTELRREMLETNARFYDPEDPDRGELAKSIGIDYVVVSKRFTDIPSLENETYHKCYENPDVLIYEIK